MINNLLTIKKKDGNVVIFNGQFLFQSYAGYVTLFVDDGNEWDIFVDAIEELYIGDHAIIRNGKKYY
jgi:hypothetical protein